MTVVASFRAEILGTLTRDGVIDLPRSCERRYRDVLFELSQPDAAGGDGTSSLRAGDALRLVAAIRGRLGPDRRFVAAVLDEPGAALIGGAFAEASRARPIVLVWLDDAVYEAATAGPLGN